ncbi:MAG: hypothetical protein H0V82_08355 [Candidatus Protochlamydia sp.]|nr:hypothetical protein [Candidatus Protochlamydia sp.]
MNLCGINIPYEEQQAEKIAANRIIANSDLFEWYDYADISGTLSGKIDDSIEILEAIKSGNPRDINNNLIDKNIVSKELYQLSRALIRTKHSVDQKISEDSAGSNTVYNGRNNTVREQLVTIEELAQKMFIKGLIDDPMAIQFLINKYDQSCIINFLPKEIQQLIVASYISNRINELNG